MLYANLNKETLDKQPLDKHSMAVANLAVLKAKKMFSSFPNEDTLNKVYIGGLLHDIGKATDFQLILDGGTTVFPYPHHHYFSYVASMFLLSGMGYNYFGSICHAILHHHAATEYHKKGEKSFRYENIDSIINDFMPDVQKAMDFGMELFNKNSSRIHNVTFCDKYNIKNENIVHREIPTIYSCFPSKGFFIGPKEMYSEAEIIRACVIWADRMVSSHGIENAPIDSCVYNIDFTLDEMIDPSFDIDQLDTSYSPRELAISDKFKDRFFNVFNPSESQREVINETKLHRNVSYNAGTGWGKTIIPVAYSIETGEPVVIVAPENNIAISIYDNIVNNLLPEVGTPDLSVELVITNKRKKATDRSKKPLQSQVIVINIDSFIAPSYRFSNNILDILYSRTVFFDEYHLFISTPTFFAYFIELIKIRTHYTNKRNLFSSATPSILHSYWDCYLDKNEKTVILPDEGRHFHNFNTKPYRITLLPWGEWPSGAQFTFCNYSQMVKDMSVGIRLYSDYTNDHKALVVNKALTEFKQHNTSKLMLGGCHVGECSMNITARTMFQIMSSIDSMRQRIGRCNRYGDDDTGDITIMIPQYRKVAVNNGRNAGITIDDHAERCIWNFQYSNDYFMEVANFLSAHIGLGQTKSMTLDEIDELYHDFYKTSKAFKPIVDEALKIGYTGLQAFRPVKSYTGNDHELTGDDQMTEESENKPDDPLEEPGVGGNNLRTLGRQFVALVRCTNPSHDYITTTYTKDELMIAFGDDRRTGSLKEKIDGYYTVTKSTITAWLDMIDGTEYSGLKKYLESKLLEAKRAKKARIDLKIDSMIKFNSNKFPLLDLVHMYDQINNGDTFESVGKGIVKI